MDPIKARLKARAAELGFTLSGIAPATDADGFARFQGWLARGYAGEMDYLHTQSEERRHPRSILETVRSVLMLGMEYTERAAGVSPLFDSSREEQGADAPLTPGRVAAYAAGPDYHRFVWDRINTLAAWLEAEVPGCRTEAVADTAPLLERDFARRAGLGWVGKNTMLLHPERGSFFFLAAVLTDLALKPDEPFSTTHCGTCTACLDACPTRAFPEPFVLDATRCISYLTIELRSDIPAELRNPMGNWLYGCDVCQDVCPWNTRSLRSVPPDRAGLRAALAPRAEWRRPALAWLLTLDEDAWRAATRRSALRRAKHRGLLRNALVAAGNSGDPALVPLVERHAASPDPTIADHARWALSRLTPP